MAFLLSKEFDAHESLPAVLGFGPFPPDERDVAYDFIKQNWDALMVKLPTDTGSLRQYCSVIMDRSPANAKDTIRF